MKLRHKNYGGAVTVDGKRYVSSGAILTVPDDVGKKILNEFPDWGKASPTKEKKVRSNG